MIPDEKKLRLINQFALAVIASISITGNVYQFMCSREDQAQIRLDYKEESRKRDEREKLSNEQKARTDELQRLSEIIRKQSE